MVILLAVSQEMRNWFPRKPCSKGALSNLIVSMQCHGVKIRRLMKIRFQSHSLYLILMGTEMTNEME